MKKVRDISKYSECTLDWHDLLLLAIGWVHRPESSVITPSAGLPKNTDAYVNAILTLFERSIEVEFATNNKHNPEHNQSILAIYTVFTAKSAVLLTTLYT